MPVVTARMWAPGARSAGVRGRGWFVVPEGANGVGGVSAPTGAGLTPVLGGGADGGKPSVAGGGGVSGLGSPEIGAFRPLTGKPLELTGVLGSALGSGAVGAVGADGVTSGSAPWGCG